MVYGWVQFTDFSGVKLIKNLKGQYYNSSFDLFLVKYILYRVCDPILNTFCPYAFPADAIFGDFRPFLAISVSAILFTDFW